ncbi:MAG: Gfo/Idh/MocA family oxidoreductase [Pseudomonadota bacterium]
MQPLNIAVVGAGLIGRKHIELVKASDECSLAAIVDPSEQASALADAAEVQWLPDFDSIVGCSNIDGVILATPNQLHFPQAMACVNAGMPVLIEKPVTQSIDEAQRLVDYCEVHSAKVLVGHHRMHSDIMRNARDIIDSGAIGDIVAVQGAALFYKPDDYFDAGPWRTLAGGGPILINMIHEVGNLRFLCGEITHVATLPSSARRGFDVEDTVGILIGFESGAVGTFILSDTAASCKSWEQTANENPDYHHDADENCYHIAGTRGSLSIPTMTLHTFTDKASWWSPMQSTRKPVAVTDPLVRQLAHFCEVIRGTASPLVGVYDGFRNLEITEQIAAASINR